MHPSFTIIIVTYKRIHQFKKAIESVLCQTFTQYECLVFNDNPADNDQIAKIVLGLNDSRFQFFPSESSKGANHWRNRGVQMANGDFIAFLDDDDIWFSENLMEHFKIHTQREAFVVYSDYIKTWQGTNKPDVSTINSCKTDDVFQAMRNGYFSISTTSSVTLKNKINWQLFDESLFSFQDWDAWFNLSIIAPNEKFYRIDKPLLYFIQHDNNRVSKNYRKRFIALNQIKNKYYKKGIDISGFFYKEKLNLLLMRLKRQKISKFQYILKIFEVLIKNPKLFQYVYTYKRIGRFLFKEEL